MSDNRCTWCEREGHRADHCPQEPWKRKWTGAARVVVLLAAALMSGCATFENSAWCSPDGKQMLFVSGYGRLGIAAKVDNGAELCRREPTAAPARPAPQPKEQVDTEAA